MRGRGCASGNVSRIFSGGFLGIAVRAQDLEVSCSGLLMVVAHALVCGHAMVRVTRGSDAVKREAVRCAAVDAAIS